MKKKSGPRLVISTMRDEGPYLLEWVAYHRILGFTDFLIYTNDCRDGTDLLLDRLQFNGVVTHVRNQVLKRGPHKSALKAALNHPLYEQAEWVYVTDADEYLNVQLEDGKLDSLLGRFPDADAIPVTWRMFSNNGHVRLGSGLLVEALADCEPAEAMAGDVGRFVKSLFRPNASVERMGLHGPIYNDQARDDMNWGSLWHEQNPSGDPTRPKTDFGYDIAQVNHYAVRSVEAYLLKRDRGRANHVSETLGIDYWTRWCRGGARDVSIQRHVSALRSEINRLLEDPITKALHYGTMAFHEKHLTALLADPSFGELRDEIMAVNQSPIATKERRPKLPPDAEPPELPALQDSPLSELVAKAPNRHKLRLRMLEEMPKLGKCAEIGVWNGGFSRAILEVTNPSELVLIDPWDLLSQQPEEEHTHKKHDQSDEMLAMYDNVVSTYGKMSNVSIVKGFSAEVLSDYPDDYFDWVYIDGNHLYEFVRKDVEISLRKVRPGGIVAGDDFFWKRNGRMHVREAVLDVMHEQGIDGRPKRMGQQFMITVPNGAQ